MFSYKKIFITYGVIIASSLISVCDASGTIDLVAMEEGSRNNIIVLDQNSLRSEHLNQHNELITYAADNPKEVKKGNIEGDGNCHLKACENNHKIFVSSVTGRIVNHQVWNDFLPPIVQQYACQVAASVTSAAILYGIYSVFKINLSN